LAAGADVAKVVVGAAVAGAALAGAAVAAVGVVGVEDAAGLFRNQAG